METSSEKGNTHTICMEPMQIGSLHQWSGCCVSTTLRKEVSQKFAMVVPMQKAGNWH